MKSFFFTLLILPLTSCNDLPVSITEPTQETEEQDAGKILLTRSVSTFYFDWEHVDWMPTPAGQSQITTPWIGQGALSCGLDVINDHKSKHGWELLYSTFDPNARGPLQNPYFILYNKYRGIMRIFIYLTTQFVATSTYIEDCIAVEGAKTSLLNFMGDDMIDVSLYKTAYTQLQPKSDGNFPLSTNKWYMMQYELAYDPNTTELTNDLINLRWSLKYYDVQEMNLGGQQQGSINGIIGASTSGSNSSLINLFQTAGAGVLAGVGKNWVADNTINESTGENSLGLPNAVFKDISSGISKALTTSVSDFPGVVIKFLSGIFGGSGVTAVPVNLTMKTTIELTGSITSGGSFPSSPTALWVPGTDISADAYGFVPYYNKPLGVVNLTAKPSLDLRCDYREQWEPDEPFDSGQMLLVTYETLYMPESIDFSEFLIVNPVVLQIADVTIEKQDLIVVEDQERVLINPTMPYWSIRGSTFFDEEMPSLDFGVRFTLKVTPKDGSPESIIVKTFQLNPHYV